MKNYYFITLWNDSSVPCSDPSTCSYPPPKQREPFYMDPPSDALCHRWIMKQEPFYKIIDKILPWQIYVSNIGIKKNFRMNLIFIKCYCGLPVWSKIYLKEFNFKLAIFSNPSFTYETKLLQFMSMKFKFWLVQTSINTAYSIVTG